MYCPSTRESIYQLSLRTLDRLYCQDTVKLFVKWLTDPDVLDSLPENHRAYFTTIISENEVEILRLLVTYLSRAWLVNDGMHIGTSCCTSVHKFLALHNPRGPSWLDSEEKIVAVSE